MEYNFSPDPDILPCVTSLKKHFKENGVKIISDLGANFRVSADSLDQSDPEYIGWNIEQVI